MARGIGIEMKRDERESVEKESVIELPERYSVPAIITRRGEMKGKRRVRRRRK